jgi:hypothetical protein
LQSQMGTVRKDLEEKIKQILKKLPKETKWIKEWLTLMR